MAMPDRAVTRESLAKRVAHLFGGDLAALLMALADAEWEREELARKLATTEFPPPA